MQTFYRPRRGTARQILSLALSRRGQFADIAAFAAIIAFIIFASSALHPGHNWGDDFGLYLHEARNILQGRRIDDLVNGIRVPPGFPTILAGWIAAYGDNFQLMKLINVLCWAGAGVAFFQVAKRLLGSFSGLLALFLFLSSPFFYFHQQSILADIPFVAALNLALLIAVGAFKTSGDTRDLDIYPKALLLFLAVLIALLIRPAGPPLVAAIVATSIIYILPPFRRGTGTRNVTIAVSALTAMLVSLTLFGTASRGQLSVSLAEYMAHDGSLFSGLAHIFPRRVSEEMSNLNVIFFWYPLDKNNSLILVALIALGSICYLIHSRDVVVPIFTIFYLVFLLLVPYNGGPRYLMPVFGPIILFVVSPIQLIWRNLIRKKKMLLLVYASIFLICTALYVHVLNFMVQQTYASRSINDDETNNAEVMELVYWLISNTSREDVICSFKPRAIMYFTDRGTCSLTPDAEPPIGAWLKIRGSRLVVIPLQASFSSYERLAKATAADTSVHEVFRNSSFVVYAVASGRHTDGYPAVSR